jgi:hypothetical protein
MRKLNFPVFGENFKFIDLLFPRNSNTFHTKIIHIFEENEMAIKNIVPTDF